MRESSIKATMCALAAVAALGAGAARAEEKDAASVSLDATAASAYVWRGQVLNEDAVLQPSLTASKAGFTINWWGNMALSDAQTGDEGEFSEHDIGISYGFKCPLTGADITLGLVNYDFPNQALTDTNGAVNGLVADTREAYLIFALSDVVLAPTLTVYYDFKEVEGAYGSLGISHSFELGDDISLSAAASIGAATEDYNDFYFGVADNALNDGNLTVSAPIAVTESFTLTPSVQYTWLLDSDVKDGAASIYKDDDQLTVALKGSYAF